MRTLLYQGSVKNIFKCGEDIEFEFTDQYSIFDWGVMPDLIKDKGASLAKIASFFFKEIESPVTYHSLFTQTKIDQNFFQTPHAKRLIEELKQRGGKSHFKSFLAPRSIIVAPVAIKRPTLVEERYDYPKSLSSDTDTLIPLEVVFRFGAPEGSSYLKRHPSLCADHKFDEIVVEFFSKLEAQDRLLSTEEAQRLAGLSQLELERLVFYTKAYALLLYKVFKERGLNLWDGKFEFAYGEEKEEGRDIILVDSIGPDELRLDIDGIPLSKELLRKLYQKDEWFFELEKNKKEYPQVFKEKGQLSPRNLDPAELDAAENLYKSMVSCLETEKTFEAQELKKFVASRFQKVAIFGQGGREHALAAHLIKDRDIDKIFLIPGNSGVNLKNVFCIDLSPSDSIEFCQSKGISYAIIGPEALLEQGLVNQLEAHKIPCASPYKEAALLETSKAFAKNLMKKYQIPTALFETFNKAKDAINYVKESSQEKFVVKLSGLAAGKGVILCHTKEEAIAAIKVLAPQDEELVIEELLMGREVSYFALCLGESYQVMGTACDYKRLLDNNEGPNTGGMGCYSPAHWLHPSQFNEIQNHILQPTLKALAQEKIHFKGMLFIGLMMTEKGAKVLEFNVRFGDPETQTILPRLQTSLAPALKAIALNDTKSLTQAVISTPHNHSVHIVKAAKGYPGTQGMIVEKGQRVENHFKHSSTEHLFFAGVKSQGQQLITSGGRVLGVTCVCDSANVAREQAYRKVKEVSFSGEQFRGDIGL